METRIKWGVLGKGVSELKDVKILERKYKYLYEGSEFFVTYYICPCCKERLLYKANTKNKFTVSSEEESFNAKSIYTCSHCRALYTSKQNDKLIEGNGYKLEYLDKDIYFDLLRDIECLGVK